LKIVIATCKQKCYYKEVPKKGEFAMSLEKLEQEIACQNRWNWTLQMDFIKECLQAQASAFKTKTDDIELIHQAFLEKSLGDESIQYYVRIFIESVYEREF
jgi:hypothetical protein